MSTQWRTMFRSMFRSLSVVHFRRYLLAQQLSLVGTWLQGTASTWLVLTLSGSAVQVGITGAFQFGPLLIIGPYSGVIADRWPRRKIMIVTQSIAALDVGMLAGLTFSHVIRVPEVWLLAFIFGVLDAFDSPARQGLLSDLAGIDQVVNATALSELTNTLARLVGPALAGVLILWRGPAVCYAADAISYLIVVAALLSIPVASARRVKSAHPRTARAGLTYAWRAKPILAVIIAVFMLGIFAFNSQVMLSALVRSHHHSPLWFGLLNTVLGIGALVGSLLIARLPRMRVNITLIWAALTACALADVAAFPAWPLITLAVGLVGLTGAAFLSSAGGVLQLLTREEMRGRVMALFSSAFLGTAVIGGPLMGYVIEHRNVADAFLVAAAGCVAGTAWAVAVLRFRGNSGDVLPEATC